MVRVHPAPPAHFGHSYSNYSAQKGGDGGCVHVLKTSIITSGCCGSPAGLPSGRATARVAPTRGTGDGHPASLGDGAGCKAEVAAIRGDNPSVSEAASSPMRGAEMGRRDARWPFSRQQKGVQLTLSPPLPPGTGHPPTLSGLLIIKFLKTNCRRMGRQK